MRIGCIDLPSDSEQITDADEEVFILYTNLQAQTSERQAFGLGQYNPSTDLLQVALDDDDGTEVEVAQHTTSLRTRKGDTGSVLWRASVDLARAILLSQQQKVNETSTSLIERDICKNLDVLELGAGTGFLGIALSHLFKSWICTDLPELIPLIQKNMSLNKDQITNVRAEPLDWTCPSDYFRPSEPKPDLIVAMDVIYHPSLLPSLLRTIEYLTRPNHTTVLIATELRSHEVIQDFLQAWLERPGWVIWKMGTWDFVGPYACWVGFRRGEQQGEGMNA